MPPTIEALYRYAVKGLDSDMFETVTLVPHRGLPKDREWALHFEQPPATTDPDVHQNFDPQAPAWTHKSKFLCAYTANELLATFETRYNDASDELTVCRRSDGKSLLVARLTDERERVESFFSDASGRRVRLVRPADDRPHHFGNTNAGFRAGEAGGCVLHLVNLETIATLNKTTGYTFEPSRFRANIVISGVPAWQEFDWVGCGPETETLWALLCVAARGATRPNGEWRYRLAVICWIPSAQRRCDLTGRCAYRTSFTSGVHKLLSPLLSWSRTRYRTTLVFPWLSPPVCHFLKVYMELGSYFVSVRTNKRHHHHRWAYFSFRKNK